MVTAQQWVDSGLIPTSGLFSWHMYESGVSGNNLIQDYSGNARHLASSPVNAATLQAGVGPNSTVSWYFDGSTTVPLTWSGALTAKHIFILASAADTTFSAYRGLFSGIGVTGGNVFLSDNSGTQFFDHAHGGTYKVLKSGVEYPEATFEAPMGGAYALLEAKDTTGISLDGLQVGKDRNVAGRIWKGHFSEMLVYTSDLSAADLKRVYLYMNLKFAQNTVGLPFYFPSKGIIPQTTMANSRYRDVPQEFGQITDSWEYEDGVKDFNTVADDAPRRWEYVYQNVSKAEKVIFDEFNRTAKRSVPFYFTDNDGVTWDNVRIESYERNHDAHKRWSQTVTFGLVGYDSTGT